VFLDAPVPRADEEGGYANASALLLMHGDGRLELVRVSDVQGELTPRAILDVDGDGNDEVFYQDAYYEGAYEHVLYFDGETPKIRILSGDGA
jgi:hypothetical protein